MSAYIRDHQTQPNPRHLVVLGDWNIRPDESTGRFRLHQLTVPHNGQPLMHILTVEQLGLDLDEWDALDDAGAIDLAKDVLPFSHFNEPWNDTFLDHVAISRSLMEIFDHPIAVTLASGTTDLRPGIRIAYPASPESFFHELTDHVPVVMTLRTSNVQDDSEGISLPPLDIVAAKPNPSDSDRQFEEVHVLNNTATAIPLGGWRIGDSGTLVWELSTGTDGTVEPGQTVIVLRRNRPMGLNNTGDEKIVLYQGDTVISEESYNGADSDVILRF